MRSTFKVSIVGVGKVGATTAYALLLDGIATDLVLVARDAKKAEGERIDLEQSLPFLQHTNISVTQNYEDIAGSDLTIVTAGAAQMPGETRLDLLKKNIQLFSEIIPKIYAANPNGLILIVTNPVDILTFHAQKIVAARPGQIFGSGALLDTARFREELSHIFHVHPRSIHAYVLGEHGDSSFPALSTATIGGQPLDSFPEYSAEVVQAAFMRAKSAAYTIIQTKGATYYAIATAVLKIVKTIYSDGRSVLPLSIPLQSAVFGESHVSISLPCILGSRGVEKVLTLPLSDSEQKQFQKSATILREAYV